MHISAGVVSELLSLDLGSAGWDGSLDPYPGITRRQFVMQHLRRSFVKKFTDGRTEKLRDDRALEKFLKCNDLCRLWKPGSFPTETWEEIALGEARKLAHDFSFNADQTDCILNTSSIGRGFAIGPGSSIGCASEDLYSKLAISKMSCCGSGLREIFSQQLSSDPVWLETERLRADRLGNADVEGSRLSFVPKTADISRTICTEPLLNMIFQKGIGSVLERQLDRLFGIRLSEQPDYNRHLAQLGSLTQGFGTIDLESASDSISTSFVEWFFPRQFVSWLKMTRSPLTILPDGSKVELHMISSMGNAFTFPLQTIIFACLVHGAYRALGIVPQRPYALKPGITRACTPGNFAVFGDDIVVDSRAFGLVSRLLQICGFRVNVEKSFNTGDFRESCGSDYFRGYDVRGVYLKNLRDVCDCYSIANRLIRWSAKHGINLPLTVQYILQGQRKLFVPYAEQDTAGVKVPFSLVRSRLRQVPGLHGSVYYRALKIRPEKRRMPKDESEKLRLPGYFYNSSGLLLSFLSGSIRNGSVTLRTMGKRRTGIRLTVSPCWDYWGADEGESPHYHRSWQRAVESNLPSWFSPTEYA